MSAPGFPSVAKDQDILALVQSGVCVSLHSAAMEFLSGIDLLLRVVCNSDNGKSENIIFTLTSGIPVVYARAQSDDIKNYVDHFGNTIIPKVKPLVNANFVITRLYRIPITHMRIGVHMALPSRAHDTIFADRIFEVPSTYVQQD